MNVAIAGLLALAQGQEQPGLTVVKALKGIAARLTALQGAIDIALLVDVSPSMSDDIQIVSQRLHESFADLMGRKLSIALAVYDDKLSWATKWETSTEPIMRTLGALKPTGSGNELLMRAVEQVSEGLGQRAANRVLIVLTDETGGDPERLEAAIAAARGNKVKVFVVGPEAPFGWPFRYERGERYFVATDVGTESFRAEVLQAPLQFDFGWGGMVQETWCTRKDALLRANRLKIGGVRDRVNADVAFDYEIGSGFGPYPLERLARETGGEFFFLRPSKFDALKDYAPDWCSGGKYQEMAQAGVRQGVLGVVSQWPMPEGYGNELKQLQQFKALPACLLRGGTAQGIAQARALIKKCDEQIKMFESIPTGKSPGRRWQANAELVKGQLAAVRHYLAQYILALSNWKPPNEVAYGFLSVGPVQHSSEADAALDAARRMLSKAAENHPSTPWAETAARLSAELHGFSVANVVPQPGMPGNPKPPPPPESNR